MGRLRPCADRFTSTEVCHVNFRVNLRVNLRGWAYPILIGLSIVAGCRENQSAAPPLAGPVTVVIDSSKRFQTMHGWEAVAQAGLTESGSTAFDTATLFTQAIDSLGIDRVRLEVGAGMENSRDNYALMRAGQDIDWRAVRYATVNDNDDPEIINPAGFHFSALDERVERIVLPMRARLAARGESLFVNLCYVAFLKSSTGYVHEDPAEYAEFMLAVFQHLQSRYGLTPNAVEMVLEPDNTSMWSGPRIGQAMVATAAKLAAAGFHPEFIAPSTSNMRAAVTYFDEMISVPGVRGLVSQLSYHRYAGVSDENLRLIAQRASTFGVSTAMLEHIGSDVEDLYRDLTLANASAWEQFTLAFPTEDNGAQYFTWRRNRPVLSGTSRMLRHYFRRVRRGAVRVAATSSDPGVRAVAFVRRGSGTTLLLHVAGAGTVSVQGLPPGRYAMDFTARSSAREESAVVVVNESGDARFSLPADGVASVYLRTEAGTESGADTAASNARTSASDSGPARKR